MGEPEVVFVMLSRRIVATVAVVLVAAAPVSAVGLFPELYKSIYSTGGAGNILVPPLDHGRTHVPSASVVDGRQAYQPAWSTCGVPDSQLTVGFQNPFPTYQAGADPDKQSMIEASGSFFVVPTLSGTLANQVAGVWFGFAESLPAAGDNVCDSFKTAGVGLATPGVYYEFYRGDNNGADGWIIPINTLLVPDHIYGAVLRFFVPSGVAGNVADGLTTGGLVPVKTLVVYAFVVNDPNDENFRPGRTPSGCRNAVGADICGIEDRTPPWPFIAPGDNMKQAGQATWTISFGEKVKNPQVSINGSPKTMSVRDGACNGPAANQGTCADVDAVALVTISTDQWGTKIVVSQTPNCGDTLSVSAQDLDNNAATKTVTLSPGINC